MVSYWFSISLFRSITTQTSELSSLLWAIIPLRDRVNLPPTNVGKMMDKLDSTIGSVDKKLDNDWKHNQVFWQAGKIDEWFDEKF